MSLERRTLIDFISKPCLFISISVKTIKRIIANLYHLDKASSPYLKQHATNPIHWYPWGDAAFEAALT